MPVSPVPTSLPSPAPAAPVEWSFDPVHSSIGFAIRHMVVSKVRGRFTKWSGAFRFDETHPAQSSVDVQIDAASVDTQDAGRDQHLRSPDFFDVARFPTLSFKSTHVERISDAELKVSGELTMLGIARPVVLHTELGGLVDDPRGLRRASFSAKATIDRKDFGMTFNQVLDRGGLALGDRRLHRHRSHPSGESLRGIP
jgi:polyisoprenoid-binding protein YceI